MIVNDRRGSGAARHHTITSVEDSIMRLEGIIGVPLPRDLAFQWLIEPDCRYFDDEVIEGIVARVYAD